MTVFNGFRNNKNAMDGKTLYNTHTVRDQNESWKAEYQREYNK